MKRLFTLLLLALLVAPVHAEDKQGGVIIIQSTSGGGGLPTLPNNNNQFLGNNGSTPEWENLSGGSGNCTFTRTGQQNYQLNCPLYVGGGGGGTGASISPTPPVGPIVGQLWFNSIDLQTYIWYDDGTGAQWVAIVNLPSTLASGSTIDSPIFTGTVTMPDGSTWNSSWLHAGTVTISNLTVTGPLSLPNGSITNNMLANKYSGIGACPQGYYVWALNANAPPTCDEMYGPPMVNPPGGQNNYAPISNPTFSGNTNFNNIIVSGTSSFTGNMTFPDGSYYDANGHEVMKNLGVGVIANFNNVNGVYGNSITVKGGWTNDNNNISVNAYWDSTGLNQMYDIDTQYIDMGNPSIGVDGWLTVSGDAENPAQNYPWAEIDLTNQSAYVGGAEDTGYDQRWQAEGFQDLNAIGIHQQTWQQGCTGVTVTAGITGSGADLSDCAVAAIASSFNNNVNYKMLLQNAGNGTASEASYLLTNNATHTGGTYLTGTGFTPIANYKSDQLAVTTNAANGMLVGTDANGGPVTLEVGAGATAQFTQTAMTLNGQLTINSSNPQLSIPGNIVQINVGSSGIIQMVSSTFYVGMSASPGAQWSMNSGGVAQLRGSLIIPSGTLTVGVYSAPGNIPISPSMGTIYYDSTLGKLRVYTGSAWQTISSS